MSEKIEESNEKTQAGQPSADFSSHGFNNNDQQEVFKMIAQTNNKDLGGMDLDGAESAKSERSRRIELPHNWYEQGKAAYGLPSEAAMTGNVKPLLEHGWRKLNQ